MVQEALTVLLIGLGVVFVGLICLIGIIYLMSLIVRLFTRERRPAKANRPEVAPVTSGFVPTASVPEASMSPEQRRQTIAAVSAAVAEYLGTDVSGIRIHSFRRVGGQAALTPDERRELIAVISAAIAEEMGGDVSGIRIRSIRRAA